MTGSRATAGLFAFPARRIRRIAGCAAPPPSPIMRGMADAIQFSVKDMVSPALFEMISDGNRKKVLAAGGTVLAKPNQDLSVSAPPTAVDGVGWGTGACPRGCFTAPETRRPMPTASLNYFESHPVLR